MFGKPTNPTPVPDNAIHFRVLMDGVLKTMDHHRGEYGREFSLAYSHLEEGRMWLGNALGEMGKMSPYEAHTKARMEGRSVKIPEAVDTTDKTLDLPKGKVNKVDSLRDILHTLVDDLKDLYVQTVTNFGDNHWMIISMEESVKAVILSKNCLGLCLGKIRDEQKMF